MSKYEGTIENIPYGILSCYINEEAVTIEEMSKAHVRVRLFEILEEVIEINFKAFFWENEEYEKFGPFEIVGQTYIEHELYVDGIYEFDSDIYREMFTRMEYQLNQFIRFKLAGVDNLFDKNADENDLSYEMLESQIKRKLELFNVQIAIDLSDPIRWNKFICDEICMRYDHIYIGNAFCHNLFPNEKQLIAILNIAKTKNKKVTIVTTYFKDSMLKLWEKRLCILHKWCIENDITVEIEINDLGFLYFLNETEAAGSYLKAFNYTYGRLINKRRKDPRYKYKHRFGNMAKLLAENSLNDDEYLAFLQKNNIARAELESCEYEIDIPKIDTSMHIPFYQTNTSQYCPLHALVYSGDRGMQRYVEECEMPCLKHIIRYSKDLNLVGKYNSLFAFDREIAGEISVLDKYINCGVDRIVWNGKI